MRGVSVIIVVACVSTASAQPPRALWVADGLSARDDAALRRAIERSSSLTLHAPDTVASELAEAAARLEADPTEAGAADALARARTAYVELRLGDAQDAYDDVVAAMLASRRRPVDAAALRTVSFERALVHLAAQRRGDALRELVQALDLDPELAPDRRTYGPPVFEALAQARRQARGRAATLTVNVAPPDATVRVDGRPAPGPVQVTRGRAHLVTAERPGHEPRSVRVDVPRRGDATADLVLPPASRELLSAQALDAWRGAGAGAGEPDPAALSGEPGRLVARAAGIERVVRASARPDGTIALVLESAATGETIRQASGGRREWEREAFHVLAEALEGRLVAPPDPPPDVSLAVSAPASVEPGAPIALTIRLRDPGGAVARVEARCGAAEAVARGPARDGREPTALVVDAPAEPSDLECVVRALDVGGEEVAGQALGVTVAAAEGRGPPWIAWGATATVVAAGVLAAVLLARRAPERTLLVDPQIVGATGGR